LQAAANKKGAHNSALLFKALSRVSLGAYFHKLPY